VQYLHKINYEFQHSNNQHVHIFFCDKNGIIKRSSTFEGLSAYKISWSYVDWYKFCFHLRSLNVRHFGMVEHYGITKFGVEVTFNSMTSLMNFIKIYQLVQKVLGMDTQTDGQTDRQTGDLISLTYLFKEIRLKN
jgi:hypothetical protein